MTVSVVFNLDLIFLTFFSSFLITFLYRIYNFIKNMGNFNKNYLATSVVMLIANIISYAMVFLFVNFYATEVLFILSFLGLANVLLIFSVLFFVFEIMIYLSSLAK
jgi:hypothetical protein